MTATSMTFPAFVRSRQLADLALSFPVLVGTVLVTLLAYAPLWTDVLLTNHTLPNVLLYPYPSFKTTYEGRWFADIVIQLLGGSGVQFVQTVLAIIIKGMNAQILCAIFGERRPWVLLITGLMLSLHPVFLDYYAFTVDAVTFEIGDTLVLLGVFFLARGFYRPGMAVLACSVCFVFATASYQPKIALCAVMLLLWLANGGDVWHENRDQISSGLLSSSLIAAGFALILSALIYYFSLKLTVVQETGGARQNINNFDAIIRQTLSAYPAVLADFSSRVDYLPRKLSWLPALMVIGGLVSALFKCYRVGLGTFVVSAISIGALPIALQVSYIINDQSWPDVGRILSPHGYLLVSCALIMFREVRAARVFVGSISSLLAFLFFIGASQEANAATLKSTFDLAKVNRIVARIEGAVPDLYMRQHSIVVIGQLSLNSIHRMKRFANRLYGSQFATEPFINYRQTELLNFYLGKEMIVRPTADQRNLALHVSAARRPWPAPESVFLQGDIIVVLLDRYTAGAPVTWIVGQSSEPLVGKQD